MTRVIVAEGCQQIDSPLTGTRYYARGGYAFQDKLRGGVFDMSPADAQLAVQLGGTVVGEAGTTKRGIGYRCRCGFGSFVVTCSRCGGECARE